MNAANMFRLTIGRRFFTLVAIAGLIMLGGTGYAILTFREGLMGAGLQVGAADRLILDVAVTLTLGVGPAGRGSRRRGETPCRRGQGLPYAPDCRVIPTLNARTSMRRCDTRPMPCASASSR